jgi:U3 small nucleolar RNA-associated protein 21
VGQQIIVYDRTRIVRTYDDHTDRVVGFLLIGRILVSYDESNELKVYDTKSRELIQEISLLEPSPVTCLVHPSTYINKILVGYANGNIELWNFARGKIIYTFTCHRGYFDELYADHGFEEMDFDQYESGMTHIKSASRQHTLPAVSCIEQSPACDVVGVGFESGDILLVNLKLDKVLFSFNKKEGVSPHCPFAVIRMRTSDLTWFLVVAMAAYMCGTWVNESTKVIMTTRTPRAPR